MAHRAPLRLCLRLLLFLVIFEMRAKFDKAPACDQASSQGTRESAVLGGGLAGSVAHREPPASAWLPFCWRTFLFVFGPPAGYQPQQTNTCRPGE